MNNFKTIELTQGKIAIVDAEDYEYLNQWNWAAAHDKLSNLWYAIRTIPKQQGWPKRTVRMHRVIMNAASGVQVDHLNHDGLDNRRINLRLATSSQNASNRRLNIKRNCSGYKGVSWNKPANKWVAQIGINGIRKHLGLFGCAKDASQAYREAAVRLHGEFACFE